MTDPSTLACERVSKHFEEAGQRLEVLKDVNLVVGRGETLAIIGASGSGKTTLLQILGGLDLPSGGTVRVKGRSFAELTDTARGKLRNEALGFVYQFHHLLPEFSALENVAMPLLVRRRPVADAEREARGFLERVGLGARLSHRPAQLSGGERQRAAVARALVTSPQLVLADEPTGNLDAVTGEEIIHLFAGMAREGLSVLVVTHEERVSRAASRVLELRDGRLA
jgi:lipoprotein-releasing system ATP-binding protein